MLSRGDIHDPVIEAHMITVPEVRMSPDLRLATIYVMPLGGRDEKNVLEALERNKRYVRGEIARRVNLKFAPEIRFRVDERFERSGTDREAVANTCSPARPRRKRIRRRERRIMSAQESPNRPARSRRKPAIRNPGDGQQKKADKRDVHGWIVLDKPVGMTSTHAVSVIKHLFAAKRAGHAGTLDPAGVGLPADRARRSHQDGAVRGRQPQDLSLYHPLGRRTRHRRRRGPGRGDQRKPPGRGGDPSPAAALYRHHRTGAAALFGSQDRR